MILVNYFAFIPLQSTPPIPTPTLAPAPTLIPTLTPTPASPSPTSTLAPTLTPSPTVPTYKSDTDNFSVSYSPARRLLQTKEISGTVYTFFLPSGSIAIHVGTSWSWNHPHRQFSDTFKVAGQNTFRFDVDDQTIIDFEFKNKKYTLQCLHSGKPELKAECSQFISSFHFLQL